MLYSNKMRLKIILYYNMLKKKKIIKEIEIDLFIREYE